MTGRNDPCICGSGKKYKKCCGRINSITKGSKDGKKGQIIKVVPMEQLLPAILKSGLIPP